MVGAGLPQGLQGPCPGDPAPLHHVGAVSGIGDRRKPQGQRKIEKGVHHQTPSGTQRQHHVAAQGRPHQNPQLPARGAEPDRALKVFRAYHVVQDELASGAPQHPRDTVHHQQRARVPRPGGFRS